MKQTLIQMCMTRQNITIYPYSDKHAKNKTRGRWKSWSRLETYTTSALVDVAKSRFIYVSDRHLFYIFILFLLNSWDCTVSTKIIELLPHCRTNTDWHVSILSDWLSYFVKRHLSVISPIFTTSSHFQTINRNMSLMIVFIVIINMSLNG